jgi:hypothetical protein
METSYKYVERNQSHCSAVTSIRDNESSLSNVRVINGYSSKEASAYGNISLILT